MSSIPVLFICLGNICRSPMAEGIFRQLVTDAGLSDQFVIDSAGTSGYHVGEKAHPGTRTILRQNGIPYEGRSRQLGGADVADPDAWLIVMDNSNMNAVRRRFGDHARLYRLLDFAENYPEVSEVPDPYYTGNFEAVYEMVRDGCEGLLREIRAKAKL